MQINGQMIETECRFQHVSGSRRQVAHFRKAVHVSSTTRGMDLSPAKSGGALLYKELLEFFPAKVADGGFSAEFTSQR